MPGIVNTHQAEAWNGYEGHHWADNRDRYDAMNSGMNEPLWEAAAIGETDRVLDVGCGNGLTTRLAARQAHRGHALGVDLSVAMLAQARATSADEQVHNVQFEQGDAQVYPFADASFDVAISRCGIMFFADPVAAFTNIGRALRPGGRLAFISLQDAGPDDEFTRTLTPLWMLMRDSGPPAAAGTSIPDDGAPVDSVAGPTSLADPNRIDGVLRGAGFTDVSATSISVPLVLGHDASDAADFVVAMGPMRFNLRSAAPVAIDRARTAVATALREHERGGVVSVRTGLWLVRATRPA